MALGSTQPLTEMSTRNIPGGEGRPARKAENLTAICEPTVYKMWEPRRLTTLWASTGCYRDSYTSPPHNKMLRRNAYRSAYVHVRSLHLGILNAASCSKYS
jgi:hypothetical protein